MDKKLTTMVESLLLLRNANFPGLPTILKIRQGNEIHHIAVSEKEPNTLVIPYNALWLVTDSSSIYRNQLIRLIGKGDTVHPYLKDAVPTVSNFVNKWTTVQSFADAFQPNFFGVTLTLPN